MQLLDNGLRREGLAEVLRNPFRLSAGALWLPLIVGNALMAQPVLFLKPVVEPDFSFSSRPRGAESVANVA